MKTCSKKYAILLVLLSVPALLFSDHYLSFNLGASVFVKEKFLGDDYSRRQFGMSTGATYFFFPDSFPLGVFAQLSLGRYSPREEENYRESMRSRESGIADLRMGIAPAFRLKLGSKVHLPLSLGPILIIDKETATEKLVSTSSDYIYRTISSGLHTDASFVFLTKSGFFIRPGISFDYIFLRAEKGEMRMNYRTTHNSKYEGVRYNAFDLALFFGLGFKI